jgi:hypothetical protein
MKIRDVLHAAMGKILDSNHWIQGYRFDDSFAVAKSKHYATAYSASGAIRHVIYTHDHVTKDDIRKAERFLNRFCQKKYGQRLTLYNDNVSHKKVLKLFSLALVKLSR